MSGTDRSQDARRALSPVRERVGVRDENSTERSRRCSGSAVPHPDPSRPSPCPSPARERGPASDPEAVSSDGTGESPWATALRVAALLAIDPHGLGGVVVRAGAGPVRERWLDALRAALGDRPWRRLPPGIGDERLIGGLDLPATLTAGRPVAARGLLAEADGGVVVVPMAERLDAGKAARLAAALDTGTLALERDGLAARHPARIGLVLLDEGDGDERVPEALADRLAFRIDLSGIGLGDLGQARDPFPPPSPIPSRACPTRAQASGSRAGPRSLGEDGSRAGPRSVGGGGGGRCEGPAHPDAVATLCTIAAALGIASPRAPLLALRAARAVAGSEPDETALTEAARLVLAHRATCLPAPEEAPQDAPEEAPEAEPEPPAEEAGSPTPTPAPPDDVVLEAVRAAIPPDLLARLEAGAPVSGPRAGRFGTPRSDPRSGRPAGARPGDPRRGRLDLVATLRAAAPWQRLRLERASPERRPARHERARGNEDLEPIRIRAEDLRIRRLVRAPETTTIFCVDASGSAARERLAEAKGAVELMLAESYSRRDRVALVAFRGTGAELVLPPTRALARARRGLAGLPGGGGTPLAAGLDAAAALAAQVRRGGGRPVVVVLTDGRANVARSGAGGRAEAGREAESAARALRAAGVPVLVLDTGARGEGARALAEAAGARYRALPRADSEALHAAARALHP